MDRFQSHIVEKHCMTAKALPEPSVIPRKRDHSEESEEGIDEIVHVQLPQPELDLTLYGDRSPQHSRRRHTDAILAASDAPYLSEKESAKTSTGKSRRLVSTISRYQGHRILGIQYAGWAACCC